MLGRLNHVAIAVKDAEKAAKIYGTAFGAEISALAESVRRAVRATINEHWGKKPLCYVHVLTV